jgi:hypothetical protein
MKKLSHSVLNGDRRRRRSIRIPHNHIVHGTVLLKVEMYSESLATTEQVILSSLSTR